MLGFFTDSYPDELLYSVCSRYHQRVGNRSKEATARDLFGTGRAKIVIDLPSRLDHLVTQLPPGHRYTVERIIDEYTMLPYYEPFMPPTRAYQLRNDMRGEGNGGSIHGRIGILTSQIRIDFLRFCPMCVADDAKQFEPYWHRIHQAPGVEICPIHAVFLEQSDIHVLNRSNNEAFVTAKQALKDARNMNTRPVDKRNRNHQALLKVAEDASWLMRSRTGATGLNDLRNRYLNLLFNRELIKGQSRVRSRELLSRFKEYFSAELLETLHCNLERSYNWLSRLIQTSRGTHHPIHHLLLMQFLGCSAEEFFRMLGREITSRTSSNESQVPKKREGRVKDSPAVKATKLETYRSQWLQAVKENPGVSRSTIRSKIPAVYGWLNKHDKEWLEGYAPARQVPSGPAPLIDWVKRDTEIAAEVKVAYNRLVNAPGRPVRASRTAIAREVRQLGAVYKSGGKLPLTNKALDELAESVEHYAIRRIWWAVERFRQENVRANYWRLLTRAAVSYKIATAPEVKAAFYAAVASLDPINESVPAKQ